MGWNRQLRLTPLNPLRYVVSKVLLSLVLVLPSLIVVYGLGAAVLGVRLSAATWALVFLGSWLSALPFAALGLIIGYIAKPDSIQQVNGLLFFLLALLGGLWLPYDQMPYFMQIVAKWTPSYWAADVARAGQRRQVREHGDAGAAGHDHRALTQSAQHQRVVGGHGRREHPGDDGRRRELDQCHAKCHQAMDAHLQHRRGPFRHAHPPA